MGLVAIYYPAEVADRFRERASNQSTWRYCQTEELTAALMAPEIPVDKSHVMKNAAWRLICD